MMVLVVASAVCGSTTSRHIARSSKTEAKKNLDTRVFFSSIGTTHHAYFCLGSSRPSDRVLEDAQLEIEKGRRRIPRAAAYSNQSSSRVLLIKFFSPESPTPRNEDSSEKTDELVRSSDSSWPPARRARFYVNFLVFAKVSTVFCLSSVHFLSAIREILC